MVFFSIRRVFYPDDHQSAHTTQQKNKSFFKKLETNSSLLWKMVNGRMEQIRIDFRDSEWDSKISSFLRFTKESSCAPPSGLTGLLLLIVVGSRPGMLSSRFKPESDKTLR